MQRIPLESARPILVFAAARLAIAVVALASVVATGFPYQGRAGAVLVAFVLWSAGLLAAAREQPDRWSPRSTSPCSSCWRSWCPTRSAASVLPPCF